MPRTDASSTASVQADLLSAPIFGHDMRYMKKHIALSLAGCLLVSVGAFAEEKSAQSPAVAAAQKKYDQAAEKAKLDYLRMLLAADKQLVTDLDAAEKAALRSTNVNFIKAADEAKKEAERQLAEHQTELKGGGKGPMGDSADVAGDADNLTAAAIVAQLPPDAKPNAKTWDAQAKAKANEWVQANVLGKTLLAVCRNQGGVEVAADGESGGGSFFLADPQGYQVIVNFATKATVSRAVKVQKGQRAKVRGIVQQFRFDSPATGYTVLSSCEIVD